MNKENLENLSGVIKFESTDDIKNIILGIIKYKFDIINDGFDNKKAMKNAIYCFADDVKSICIGDFKFDKESFSYRTCLNKVDSILDDNKIFSFTFNKFSFLKRFSSDVESLEYSSFRPKEYGILFNDNYISMNNTNKDDITITFECSGNDIIGMNSILNYFKYTEVDIDIEKIFVKLDPCSIIYAPDIEYKKEEIEKILNKDHIGIFNNDTNLLHFVNNGHYQPNYNETEISYEKFSKFIDIPTDELEDRILDGEEKFFTPVLTGLCAAFIIKIKKADLHLVECEDVYELYSAIFIKNSIFGNIIDFKGDERNTLDTVLNGETKYEDLPVSLYSEHSLLKAGYIFSKEEIDNEEDFVEVVISSKWQEDTYVDEGLRL